MAQVYVPREWMYSKPYFLQEQLSTHCLHKGLSGYRFNWYTTEYLYPQILPDGEC